jgi:hypothetical protein
MSGVNAHALLSPGQEGDTLGRISKKHLLQRVVCWPTPAIHPLLQHTAVSAGRVEVACSLSAPSLSWMLDHRVQGRALLPGAAMFEMVLAVAAACVQLGNSSSNIGLAPAPALQEASIIAPLIITDTASAIAACSLTVPDGGIRLSSGRIVHLSGCAGRAEPRSVAAYLDQPSSSSMSQWQRVPLKLRIVTETGGHNLACVERGSTTHHNGYLLHPATFDACIHLAPVPAAGGDAMLRVPVSVAALRPSGSTGK